MRLRPRAAILRKMPTIWRLWGALIVAKPPSRPTTFSHATRYPFNPGPDSCRHRGISLAEVGARIEIKLRHPARERDRNYLGPNGCRHRRGAKGQVVAA